MKRPLITIGWREWVQLPDLGGPWLKAKIDTGARSSHLHAFGLEPFERDSAQWVRFSAAPRVADADGQMVEFPVHELREVKNSSGVSEMRPVIRTRLILAGVSRDIELALTTRDEMGIRLLIGREGIRGDFVVDPKRSIVTGMPPNEGERPLFEIAGMRIAAGTEQRVSLPIARLATGAEVLLQMKVLHGRQEGPSVWIDAAIHGDEIGGVEIIRRVLSHLDPETMCGTLIVVPVVNVHGFVNAERYLPDRRDLNRSFPGGKKGSLARRIAYLIMTEVVARCTVGFDLHTGSDGRTNLPQIRANLTDPKTLRLARAFGAPVMVNARPREASIRGSATAVGTTVLVFEGGEASRFDPVAMEAGTAGVLRVLAELGMIQPVVDPQATTVRSDKSKWVRAARSGLAQADCQPGDVVSKGQILGRVHDSFGQELSVSLSPLDGIIIGQRLEPMVNRGDALFHVAATVPEGVGAASAEVS